MEKGEIPLFLRRIDGIVYGHKSIYNLYIVTRIIVSCAAAHDTMIQNWSDTWCLTRKKPARFYLKRALRNDLLDVRNLEPALGDQLPIEDAETCAEEPVEDNEHNLLP